jgi:hypothetical protein
VERHARVAIEKFKKYPAAGVMPGLGLEEQQKANEAHDACGHAATADAAYLRAYLCSVEVSTRNAEWKMVLNASNRVVQI